MDHLNLCMFWSPAHNIARMVVEASVFQVSERVHIFFNGCRLSGGAHINFDFIPSAHTHTHLAYTIGCGCADRTYIRASVMRIDFGTPDSIIIRFHVGDATETLHTHTPTSAPICNELKGPALCPRLRKQITWPCVSVCVCLSRSNALNAPPPTHIIIICIIWPLDLRQRPANQTQSIIRSRGEQSLALNRA